MTFNRYSFNTVRKGPIKKEDTIRTEQKWKWMIFDCFCQLPDCYGSEEQPDRQPPCQWDLRLHEGALPLLQGEEQGDASLHTWDYLGSWKFGNIGNNVFISMCLTDGLPYRRHLTAGRTLWDTTCLWTSAFKRKRTSREAPPPLVRAVCGPSTSQDQQDGGRDAEVETQGPDCHPPQHGQPRWGW